VLLSSSKDYKCKSGCDLDVMSHFMSCVIWFMCV
jgi:hypothetical protein